MGQSSILIFDDEPLVLSAMQKCLERVGYDVTAVTNGQEFQSSLKHSGYSLLIIDRFIAGFDSKEAVRTARELYPGIRVLMVSGSSPRNPEYPFIQKPFKINDLRNMVSDLLNG